MRASVPSPAPSPTLPPALPEVTAQQATAPAVAAVAAVAKGTSVAAVTKNVAAGPTVTEQAIPAASTATHLSTENVEEVWKQVLNTLTGMVTDHAAEADDVSVDETGRLVVSFGESFHRDFCERPTNRSRLEEALQTVCGQKIGVVLKTHLRADVAAKPVVRAPSRRQQQAEIATQPFVKKALELFNGDPDRLRYVPPREKQ